MEFDLHTHTMQGSACSRMHVHDLIQAASDKKLTGICITDHDYLWDQEELVRLNKESGLQIFSGIELSTSVGEVLIYGIHKSLLNLRDDPGSLAQVVKSLGGVMVAAHPFRSDFGLSTLSRDECGLDPLSSHVLTRRQVFKFVDTVEVYNGRSSQEEIQMARRVAGLLGKNGTGGSDAHSIISVGSCVTVFEQPVNSEADLVRQLRNGNFQSKKRS